ncbi:MAG: S9 family peptidase [Acidobacteria bacterium]|nr:S9 family peptidase [Acidobacteriota bacterium]
MQRLAPAVFVALSVSSWAALPAQETHPFSVHDMLAMERLSDPQMAPDGSTVAFVVRTTDLAANRGRTDLWSVPVEGGAPRRLTTHEAADYHPRWSPDGRDLYFLSTRSGSAQVWRLPLAGGEPRQVTDLPLDVGNLVVSPDGRRIALTMDVFAECETLDCTAERLEERASGKTTGVGYDDLFVRHWDVWKDGRRSHVFVLELDDSGAAAGDPVDLMNGLDQDAPPRPFGGAEEIAFAGGGSAVIFASRAGGTPEAWSTNFDLYLAPADGSSEPVNLTASNPAWDSHPVLSPDGDTLAWVAMERPGYESDRFQVRLARLDGERLEDERALTADWDRSVSGLAFSADGGTLYVTAADLGQRSLFAVDVAGGEVTRLHGEGSIAGLAVSEDRLVKLHNDLAGPSELYVSAPDGGGRKALTAINAEQRAAARVGSYEQFTFAGWNNETVHGYVVRPVDFDPDRRYPVAFLIHGGPQGSFGNSFHYRWNPQAYAGAGYAAVMIDFHGSVGYGQNFTDSIRGDWGGKPLEDLKKGLAAALDRYPFLDGDRVCALGASYGGYMVNWIAGAWPDRFRCLVNHDGVFDLRSMYYTTEELWFVEWDHRGSYFDNPEGFETHNPALLVDRWQTPMLVIHGALDFRVPETQGLAAFTALKRRGVPARLLYFPDENHWVLRPANSIQWHEEVLGWLARWLEP